MIMTVKEAEKKIEELQEQRDDFLKLNNYAMCLDLTKPGESSYADSPEKDVRREMLQKIREEADLIMDIRTIGTIGYNLCTAEIQRIQTIIDNSKINI